MIRPRPLFAEYSCTVRRGLWHSRSGSSNFLDKKSGGERHAG